MKNFEQWKLVTFVAAEQYELLMETFCQATRASL